MTSRDALLAAARGKAPTEPVTVPAAWIHDLEAPDDAASVDLSRARVGELLDRSPITISGWCRAGLFPGAYRLRGKEWRIPAASLQAFQRDQSKNANAVEAS